MPFGELLLGFAGGLVTDLARGMSLDRIRKKAEQAANPDSPPGGSEAELLRDISNQLREANHYAEAHGPGVTVVEFVDVLYRGAGLEHVIDLRGRKHMAMYPSNPGVIVAFTSSLGTINFTLPQGVYTEFDASKRTTYRLADTSPNASENIAIRLFN